MQEVDQQKAERIMKMNNEDERTSVVGKVGSERSKLKYKVHVYFSLFGFF